MRWGTEEQTIRALQTRLQWLMHEADAEEFDGDEVTAIVDLLQIMDPVERKEGEFYTAEKANSRFWTFYAFRQKSEQSELPYPIWMKMQMRLRHIFRSAAFVNGSFILALVVAMILGGTAVVYGQKTGFFSTIETDKVATITSPDDFNRDTVFCQEYETIEQVPIQYLNYVWAPSSDMQPIDLQRIVLVCDSKFVKVECLFKKEGSDFFARYTKKSYKDAVTTIDKFFDSYSFYMEEVIKDIEVSFYEKVNEDYTEYIATFISGNSLYYMYSNLDIDAIKEIVYNSIDDSIL